MGVWGELRWHEIRLWHEVRLWQGSPVSFRQGCIAEPARAKQPPMGTVSQQQRIREGSPVYTHILSSTAYTEIGRAHV